MRTLKFLGLTLGLLLVVSPVFAQSLPDDYGTSPSVNAPNTLKGYCPNLSLTFQRGARDAATKGQVSELQKFLADYYDIEPEELVTGYFGRITQSYLAKFQKEQGLPAYGIAGSLTRAMIAKVCAGGIVDIPTNPPPTPQPPVPPQMRSTLELFYKGVPVSVIYNVTSTVAQSICGMPTFDSCKWNGQSIQGVGRKDGEPALRFFSGKNETFYIGKENYIKIEDPSLNTGSNQNQNGNYRLFLVEYKGATSVSTSVNEAGIKSANYSSGATGLLSLETTFEKFSPGNYYMYAVNVHTGVWGGVSAYTYLANPPSATPAPTCTLDVRPQFGGGYVADGRGSVSLKKGESLTIGWNGTNSLYAGGPGGKDEVNGTRIYTPQSNVTYAWTFYGNGGTAECSVEVFVEQTSEVSGTINSGTFFISKPTMSGAATGVSHVGISMSLNGGKVYGSGNQVPVVNGKWSHTVTTALVNGTYGVQLYTADNKLLAENTIKIATPTSPLPTLTFTASPTTISLGQSTTLSWTATNVATCSASGAWSGTPLVSNNTISKTPTVTGNSTYVISCSGPGGSISKSATVTVTPPTTTSVGTLTVSPATVAQGQAQSYSWANVVLAPEAYIRTYQSGYTLQKNSNDWTALHNGTPAMIPGSAMIVQQCKWAASTGAPSVPGSCPNNTVITSDSNIVPGTYKLVLYGDSSSASNIQAISAPFTVTAKVTSLNGISQMSANVLSAVQPLDSQANQSGMCVNLQNSSSVGSTDATTNGDVSNLQSFLLARGYMKEITGYFGVATAAAVTKFQGENQLIPTGIVGMYTRAKIKELSCQ